MCSSNGIQILCPLFSCVAAVGYKPCVHYFHEWQQWNTNPVPITSCVAAMGYKYCAHYFHVWQQWDIKPCAHYFRKCSSGIQTLCPLCASSGMQTLSPLFSCVAAVASLVPFIFLSSSSGMQTLCPLLSCVVWQQWDTNVVPIIFMCGSSRILNPVHIIFSSAGVGYKP